MPVVVDASAALAWLLPDETAGDMDAILAGASDDPPLVTPLWLYEVANAVSVGLRRNRLSESAANDALDLIASVPVRVAPAGWLVLREAFRIAGQTGLSVYDASYLQLARHAQAPLATLDARMQSACGELGIALWAPGQ